MINIAIDGTSGSGKSTVAKLLANKLGFYHLNTGALYRAFAVKCIKLGYQEITQKEIDFLVKNTIVTVEFVDNIQRTLLDGEDVTEQLSDVKISTMASLISPYLQLREKVVDIQRNFAKENNVVMEGRDIGSAILPNAEHKFFVTASAEERARRRFEQFAQEGKTTTYEEVLQALIERDKKDIEREHSPLVVAKDAIVVDTSNMTIDEAVSFLASHIRQ